MAESRAIQLAGDRSPLHLLSIPQELRDQILQEALCVDIGNVHNARPAPNMEDVIFLRKDHQDCWETRRVKSTYRNLSLSCKQLRQDAVPIFFEGNRFEQKFSEAGPQTVQIPDHHCRLIKNLIIFSVPRVWRSFDIANTWIRVSGLSVETESIGGGYYKILPDGTEVAYVLEQSYLVGDYCVVPQDAELFLHLKPVTKLVHDALQTGEGVGVDLLKEVKRCVDAVDEAFA